MKVNTHSGGPAAQLDLQSKVASSGNLKDAKQPVSSSPDSAQSTLAKDVYHGAQAPSPALVYDRPLAITSSENQETPEQYSERMDAATGLLFAVSIPKIAEDMSAEFAKVTKEIEQLSPGLSDKDWGFSVNEDGALVVSGDDLTDSEKQLLEEKLNENEELVALAKTFQDTMMEGIDLLKGPNESGDYWAKYDINRSNFADIIDFKALMEESSQSDAQVKLGDARLNQFTLVDSIGGQLQRNARQL
ncbi:hypothetical protein CWB99_01175 [Pseudoalteromonas rubra]|uniref:Uncharacterized protein n=1 Tax=Pseudoalteromonas rubra TaxID=43658 RepID=A0A5S3WU03_9GAMM|nr:hypothetical protein [Pseudoalteromonas rubra]TMP28071.1 hypothetical protein CWC00_21900 [Pseudoalteromonas rubra]TMP32735.1 hypothetical protein CWB99_01175 [Pseudoalteromonas rubra]